MLQKEKLQLTKLMQIFKTENAIWKHFLILGKNFMAEYGK